MYPSLSTRRRLLLALLILGGKSTYSIINSFLPAGRHGLPIGYSGPKFYGMLKRLEKEGLVRRSRKSQTFADSKRQKSDFCRTVRLLPAGIELLERRYGPRIWQLKVIRLSVEVAKPVSSLGSVERNPLTNRASQTQPLNDSWSLVILNFPTSQAYSRSRLAGRLMELGCGPLRDGVYVSPYPILPAIAEWAEENRCLERVALATINNQQSTINNFLNGWDLSSFSRRYLSFLDRLTIAKGITLPQKQNRAISRIKSDFIDFLIRDPLLPESLLPTDWPLSRVIKELVSF